MKKTIALCTLLCCFLFATGCGPPKGKVSGKVTFEGKPVPSGQVMFMGPDGVPHMGEIQPEGTYEVANLPYGEAIVTVARLLGVDEYQDKLRAAREKGRPLPSPPTTVLPAHYDDPHTTPLRFKVEAPTGRFDISLKKD